MTTDWRALCAIQPQPEPEGPTVMEIIACCLSPSGVTPATHPHRTRAMYPLATTTVRIDACNPCQARRQRAAKLLNITEPSDEPITYAQLLDVLGLDDALWACRAEPDLAPVWRRYAVWCAKQARHLMTDQRSLDALDVAERYANGAATAEELAAARAAASAAARDAAWDARDAASAAASAAAWAAARDAASAARAAWAAAWDAAWAAAWDARDAASAAASAAAWAAARDAASAARDAARDAARAAAWDAAWDARDAASAAARDAQVAAFRRLVTIGNLD